MSCWSFNKCAVKGEPLGGGASWYQECRLVRTILAKVGEVRCSCSHDLRSLRKAGHCATAVGAGHRTTCDLSSSGHWQHGQLAMDRKCHHCIFLPWEKWPETNLLTHLHQCRGILDIACWYEGQSIMVQITEVIARRCCQYLIAGSPLIWICRVNDKFFTMRLPPT